jgi:hypothetical protein
MHNGYAFVKFNLCLNLKQITSHCIDKIYLSRLPANAYLFRGAVKNLP